MIYNIIMNKVLEDRKIEYIKKSELKISKNNPRIHPKEQINIIQKSIEEFSFINPIIIDENNRVLAGHARLLAVNDNVEVPCLRVNHLTDDEQKDAYMYIDNASYELGKWDIDLKEELENKLPYLTDMLDKVQFDIDDDSYKQMHLDVSNNTEKKCKKCGELLYCKNCGGKVV